MGKADCQRHSEREIFFSRLAPAWAQLDENIAALSSNRPDPCRFELAREALLLAAQIRRTIEDDREAAERAAMECQLLAGVMR